jgi:hypothetical protein
MPTYNDVSKYTIINRSFVLEWEKLEAVALCEFKGEEDPDFAPAVKIKLDGTWLTLLAESKAESEEMLRTFRKIIMSNIPKRNPSVLKIITPGVHNE